MHYNPRASQREPGFGDKDVDSMVEFLWSRYKKAGNTVAAPVNPFRIAGILSVVTVELGPMLSDGGLALTPNGFVVCIRDLHRPEPQSFSVGGPDATGPRLTPRQRFSLAHELGHTLFFKATTPPVLRRNAPKGKKLEALCHRAALRILLPGFLIEADMKTYERIASSQILQIAAKYDVSPEVALSRCDELLMLRDANQAVLYVRKNRSGVDEIARSFCPNWFVDRFKRPAVNSPTGQWLSRLVKDDQWRRPNATFSVQHGPDQVQLKNVPYRDRRYFVELDRVPASRD